MIRVLVFVRTWFEDGGGGERVGQVKRTDGLDAINLAPDRFENLSAFGGCVGDGRELFRFGDGIEGDVESAVSGVSVGGSPSVTAAFRVGVRWDALRCLSASTLGVLAAPKATAARNVRWEVGRCGAALFEVEWVELDGCGWPAMSQAPE